MIFYCLSASSPSELTMQYFHEYVINQQQQKIKTETNCFKTFLIFKLDKRFLKYFPVLHVYSCFSASFKEPNHINN